METNIPGGSLKKVVFEEGKRVCFTGGTLLQLERPNGTDSEKKRGQGEKELLPLI